MTSLTLGPATFSNHLLASLPPEDQDRLAAAVAVMPLRLREVLHTPGAPVQDVFFPGAGFCSVVTLLQDGVMVEILTVGREGAVGLSAAMSGAPSTTVTMVQGEGSTCYRLPVEAFRAEMDRGGAFSRLVQRYLYASGAAIMQSTACNAVHSVEQRLARWLLLASDRMEANQFPLTQEFAAMMLGASRPTVTIVAGTLQRAGLITYKRGQLSILDREALEEASCECYETIRNLWATVMDGA